ncbi:MAG TPA: transporter substrate-binding domain-containing protein [Thermoplasmata archaeon]|nr:transporter substrate-binding domain-containing protein [Thermoplasmata archaeon]
MAVAVVVVVGVAALGAGIEIGRTVLAPSTSSKAHFLIVGTNIPFPPFENFNTTTGLYEGFDINFSAMVAFAAHRTLVIQNYADFGVLLLDAGKGAVDMAASAITMSGSAGATRNGTMSFSIPYYNANQAVLVRSGSTLSCPSNTCTQVQLESLIVGVQSGTTSETWANTYLAPNMSNPTNQLKHFTTVDVEIASLSAGALDAVIIDNPIATSYAGGSGGKLKVAGQIITGELYGFAVAHGDPEGLVPIINSVIAQSMTNGTYQKLISEWFGHP